MTVAEMIRFLEKAPADAEVTFLVEGLSDDYAVGEAWIADGGDGRMRPRISLRPTVDL